MKTHIIWFLLPFNTMSDIMQVIHTHTHIAVVRLKISNICRVSAMQTLAMLKVESAI